MDLQLDAFLVLSFLSAVAGNGLWVPLRLGHGLCIRHPVFVGTEVSDKGTLVLSCTLSSFGGIPKATFFP